MSTGSGSTGGSGAGYRVEVDGLRAFASQVRGLLNEFQTTADGTRVHGQSGVGGTAFGSFPEAVDLHEKYQQMRDGLRDVLNALYDAIDEAQRKADLTAVNYEEQELETSRTLRISSDGWSVGNPSATSQAAYGTNTGTGNTASQPKPTGTASPTGPVSSASPSGSGEPKPSW
ncbi:hypothetical protein AB0D08_10635 [Kitasatospora sp. NPDC048540]|uniref:hypothetical protein n=1 Tax=Kitasatospora sp. NPDC048540 TaxID=3155634 RepID=UPI0033C97CEB